MLSRATRKFIAAFAVSMFVPVAYFAAIVFVLSRNTLQMYGFPVSPDLRTATEITLQICPFLAALLMILVSSFRENLIQSLAQRWILLRHYAYTFAMLAVNLFMAVVAAILTAAAIVTVCGLQPSAAHLGTLLWVAFEFIVDITLVGIFTLFLHAFTRRVWATFLLFVTYAGVVVIFGTRWGITSFIGFGSTVPVRLSSYSSWPLYDAAGWLFRAYWIAIAVVLVAILHRFSRSSESLAITVHNEWSAPETKRWKYGFAAASAGWLAIAICLFQFQQYALTKYRSISPAQLDRIVSEIAGDGRLRMTDYDVQLAYEPDRQRVRVLGRLTLENQETSTPVAYLQLPTVLTLDNLELAGSGPYKLTNLGKYVRIEWASPFPSGQRLELRYSGIIQPAGPFDLTLQAKLLTKAFFFTDSDILVAPRRPSCLISNKLLLLKRAALCEQENYAMSDFVTGTIYIVAPAGFIAVGPGDRQLASDTQSVFKVATPQLAKFMVACARFVTTSAPAMDGLPAVRLYRAKSEGNALAEAGQSVIAFYQKYWPAYRLSELRIIETPTLLGEAVAFDGLLTMGDRVARSRDPVSGQTSNLAQFVLAHELAHQWWAYQVIPAKVPGQLFVLESFAQFSAYKYLESRGILSDDTAIQNEKNHYALARARLTKAEAPLALLQQNDLELAYHKGPFVLLSLDKMSGNSLMPLFGELIERYAQNSPGPAQPQQIVKSLVDHLPVASRKSARYLLFAPSAQVQSLAESAILKEP